MKNTQIVLLMTMLNLLGSVPHASAAENKLPRNQAAKNGYKDASVHLGDDGKLVYTPDERGNRIPDFSRCGYMGGGVKLPDVPVKITLEPREGMPKELETYDPENPILLDAADDAPRVIAGSDPAKSLYTDDINRLQGAHSHSKCNVRIEYPIWRFVVQCLPGARVVVRDRPTRLPW